MAQARTLKERELRQLLGFIELRRHALRNRIVLLLGISTRIDSKRLV